MYSRERTMSGKLDKSTNQKRSVSLFSWGDNKCGQLGFSSELSIVKEPTLVKEFQEDRARAVKEISCSSKSSVVLLQGGSVYCMGSDHKGLCRIDSLDSHVIRQVAAGSEHFLALSDEGRVLSWGDNKVGQLGLGHADNVIVTIPKVVGSLRQLKISQVSTGLKHSLILSDQYQLFSFGDNTFGQLGLGHCNSVSGSVMHIASLWSLPVVQITCGDNHNFVRTYSGVLFGWGSNEYGQVGTGCTQNKFSPTQCKNLRSQRIVYVTCGANHTVALTVDGGVFTFGAGADGQLGHSDKENKVFPKKITELMGSAVSQIACGDSHTLAYVASANRVYAFGSDDLGQLGLGTSNHDVNEPQVISGPWVTQQAHRSGNRKLVRQISRDNIENQTVLRIFAGGAQNFVKTCQLLTGLVSEDFRLSQQKNAFHGLPLLQLDTFLLNPIECKESLIRSLQVVSSFNCIFTIKDEHFNPCKLSHGLDLDLCSETFSKCLSVIENNYMTLLDEIFIHLNTLLRFIITYNSHPDIESLRFLLLIPFLWPLENSILLQKISIRENELLYAMIVNKMGSKAANTVVNYWFQIMPLRHFNRLVKYFMSLMTVLIEDKTSGDHNQLVCLELLKRLYEINQNRKEQLPLNAFYIAQLGTKIDLKQEYVLYYQKDESKKHFSICKYPFIFDVLEKITLLEIDAHLQMCQAVNAAQFQNFFKGFMAGFAGNGDSTGQNIDLNNPLLIIEVSRANILRDTLSKLVLFSPEDFKKPLKIRFAGEEAIDAGGVAKEFFLLIFREIMKPDYGMFHVYSESRLMWFSLNAIEEDCTVFRIIGILCGLAIYNRYLVDFSFPTALFKKLLGKTPILEDLKELDYVVGNSLQNILDLDETVDLYELFCLTFEVEIEVFNERKCVPLTNTPTDKVTTINRHEYVNAYIDFIFNRSCEKAYASFHEGFLTVIGGGDILNMFQPVELKSIMIGDNQYYDWDSLKAHTTYKGEYWCDHPVIQHFWSVFYNDLNELQKKNFLQFLTGCDRVPAQGMGALSIVIQPVAGADLLLPVAHTCFNLLDLPLYSTRDLLREKMIIAIEQTEGFALV